MDYSTATAVLSCPQRAKLRNLLKLGDPAPSPAKRFGEAWHRAQWMRALQYDNAHGSVALMERALSDLQWSDPDDYRNAGKLLMAFNAWCDRPESTQWIPLLAERGFSVDIGAVEPLEGKIDALVQYGNEIWLLDYKTTSRMDADWVALYRVSYQFKWYLIAARRLFPQYDIKGVIVDVYHATKGVKKGATTADITGNRFYTQYFTYTPEVLAEAARDFKAAAIMWKDMKTFDAFPRNTSACMQYGRPCEFLELCLAEPGLRADLMKAYPAYDFDPLAESV